ncbi:hypothetical protein SLS53_008767 [Cytospora paraplurivora]|uniref:CWH43-like N-terminal domain-containing protein n=1 Tax=Cytospora paraplurivora TaxID=2898453 RepID=A0AAN9YCQ7_9PEZI
MRKFSIPYWIVPIISGCSWLGGLLALLCEWIRQGKPHYAFLKPEQRFLYISDIGATSWGQPIFIATSAFMVVTFDLVFIGERWMRHTGRLAPNHSKGEKVCSILSIVCSIIGAAGLILLTIFDTRDYPKVHDGMLGVFIGGYVVSAICVCIEYGLMGLLYRKHEHQSGVQTHHQHRILITSFVVKLIFILIEMSLAIAFGVTEYHGYYNKSAILEWIVALVYIFYVWSYALDFLPATNYWARRTRGGLPPVKRPSEDSMEMAAESNTNAVGGPVYAPAF